ncbi:alpha/beta hydrolase-fold protein [Mycobacterium sp. CVI_P3]|uniref:Alpha/beta hydrolase-fold protein n=1 Tax=Mycobacterium pinniadriaticum TaxID=2994102 RepID=A0ABT3SMZ4_9MYCO|nr:alpha/beta hydrolase-fold protein [Mycobacterium pinniadriaticum]MCX2934121.1 alpha/beta hydrolase-fold protein [Mycobacterium pinniadriaticum]MCX2940543.1 alpha/beta hydrolase-fold protein [Mycobacterium pinniadriaticum]
MHGWLPLTVQIVTGLVLLTAVGWRTLRWRLLWLPLAAVVGIAAAGYTWWSISDDGLAGEPAPDLLWAWIAVTGLAVVVAIAGWRGARWWRRGLTVLAVPLCALSTALMLNLWVGYLPTVQTAWNQLTAGPLPDQTDRAAVTQMVVRHTIPATGSVVPVTIGSEASHFAHRGELVYLPPAYFATNPPPRLPTVMMIGGEFNTPADWLRAGNAIKTIDDFAAAHQGNAPVFVFVDSGGTFNNDTECVNGPRGNSADHLTKDVVPFMISNFGVSADPANWGVVGWSMGGTCAVGLTTMHPDMFSTFEDIAGDFAPNSGTRTQTISRLFGGDALAYANFEPASAMSRHGRYQGVSGWFAVSGNPASQRTPPKAAPDPGDPTGAADALCGLGSANGIDCAVIAQPGKHDWPFAARAFAAALPWLAGRLRTPDVAPVPLPGPPVPPPGPVTIAAAGRPPGVR